MTAISSTGGSYFATALNDHDAILRDAREVLADVDYDTMIGRGLSGALVVPWLAQALGKSWAIVRKDNDGSHSGSIYEGTIGNRWVFVDDFISSGATLRITAGKVEQAVRTFNEYRSRYDLPHYTTLVGAYSYERSMGSGSGFFSADSLAVRYGVSMQPIVPSTLVSPEPFPCDCWACTSGPTDTTAETVAEDQDRIATDQFSEWLERHTNCCGPFALFSVFIACDLEEAELLDAIYESELREEEERYERSLDDISELLNPMGYDEGQGFAIYVIRTEDDLPEWWDQ